jgi:FAD/FMN-containing dehydrogenase
MAEEFHLTSKVLSAGRAHRFRQLVAEASSVAGCRTLLSAAPVDLTFLPFGAGQSLGDSCLNDGGGLIVTRAMDRVLQFDRTSGTVVCEPGVTMGQLADISLSAPDGQSWFPAVFPGNTVVTVGGAIANDVHGKNHLTHGSFCHHVDAFTILRSDGSFLVCNEHDNAELFRATLGGLGLTGIIVSATLGVRRCAGSLVESEEQRCESLSEALPLFFANEGDWEYLFYWLDTFDPAGRGIFTRARHCAGTLRDAEPQSLTMRAIAGLPVPATMGGPALWRAWYRLALSRAPRKRIRRTPYRIALAPLGEFRYWNRLLGPRGLMHQQSVVPVGDSALLFDSLLADCRNAGEPPCLASVKRFGSRPPAGILSFPREGFTIALDFANRGETTWRLLRRLEARVLEAGGAIYPGKDSSLSPEGFRKSFPAWQSFASHIDPHFSSSFWRRTGGIRQ